MTLDETLKQLKALGNEKMRAHNTKYGAGDQFGVKHGDIRVLAKKIKTDHKLAMSSPFAPIWIEAMVSRQR